MDSAPAAAGPHARVRHPLLREGRIDNAARDFRREGVITGSGAVERRFTRKG
ncbi:hypothetical protein OHA40_33100 [Nocardia sp. NBC_00508]|uniref:hypothetical protein n=1 Tax=Nocardia sp. NBC_00508 TaxID=2975992 RepID=UPI002E804E8D|nr:hypothetical protein [Nocardia sp. NBC_00508]WUD66331.1 hypothetical protein OHA40_33100 [Nocardia sp. NBC_00508]